MISRIGVVGAGQMGSGIAVVFAQSDLQVRLLDVSNDVLHHAVHGIESGLARQVNKGKLDHSAAQSILRHIETGTDYAMFSDCDMVIEAATEKESVKRDIFKRLIPALRPETIIASNTSSLSITRLGAATDRPQKFMGMHFMNPAPSMQLVELIRGIATAEQTFAAVRELAIKIGKTPVAVEDFPAFIVHRIVLPMINEAAYALYEGVASVDAIDTAMRLGAHHPMGPLELADFIGLDSCLSLMQSLYDGLADTKYRPCPLLVKYVEAGWHGRKTGRGFYDYTGEKPVPTR